MATSAATSSSTISTYNNKFWELMDKMSRREIGHKTVDRETGKIVPEKQPLSKRLWLELLFNPVTEYLDATEGMRYFFGSESIHDGHKYNKESSAKEIEPFVKFHNINMNWFQPDDIKAYKSFNEFFTRELKPGARTIASPNDPNVVVSAADCRIVVFETVEQSKKLWIKGNYFTIGSLLEDETLARPWVDGPLASFRLSPQDYHHYHSPIDGKVDWFKAIQGTYYGVDPTVTNSKLNVLCANARTAICIDSPNFGKVLLVAIGAEGVGSVQLEERVKQEGCKLKKGDKIGKFAYGGSNLLVCFEKGKMQWDADLIKYSKEKLEANVKMGEHIGRKVEREE